MLALVHKLGIMHNGAQTGSIENWGSETIVTAAENASAERHYISIGNPVAGALRANTLMLYHLKDGVYTKKAIFGEHNKPSGSYTGNGSAETRTFNIGGIGNFLAIRSSAGLALVTPNGAIFANHNNVVSFVPSSQLKFTGGVLTLAITNNEITLNSSSITYYYEVL